LKKKKQKTSSNWAAAVETSTASAAGRRKNFDFAATSANARRTKSLFASFSSEKEVLS